LTYLYQKSIIIAISRWSTPWESQKAVANSEPGVGHAYWRAPKGSALSRVEVPSWWFKIKPKLYTLQGKLIVVKRDATILKSVGSNLIRVKASLTLIGPPMSIGKINPTTKKYLFFVLRDKDLFACWQSFQLDF
jgi:hypothetical protein